MGSTEAFVSVSLALNLRTDIRARERMISYRVGTTLLQNGAQGVVLPPTRRGGGWDREKGVGIFVFGWFGGRAAGLRLAISLSPMLCIAEFLLLPPAWSIWDGAFGLEYLCLGNLSKESWPGNWKGGPLRLYQSLLVIA